MYTMSYVSFFGLLSHNTHEYLNGTTAGSLMTLNHEKANG